MLVARSLGKADFGSFGLISGAMATFQALSSLGLGISVTKFVAEYRVRAPERAGQFVAVSVVLSVVAGGVLAITVFSCADWIASGALHAAELAPHVRVSSLALPFAALWGVQAGTLVGFGAFRLLALVSLVAGVLTALCTVLGSAWGGLPYAVWGAVIGTATAGILAHVALWREARATSLDVSTLRWELASDMIRFALPAFLAGIVATPATWGCAALLNQLPQGASELGAFNAANQWFGALLLVPGLVSQVALPSLTRHIAAGSTTAARAILARSVIANAIVGVTLAAVLALFARPLLGLYGADFGNGALTLAFSVFAAALVGVQSPVAQVLAAADRMWANFALNMVWAGIMVALSLEFVAWGANGIAFARLVAYAAHTVLLFAVVRRVLSGPPVSERSLGETT
jgi:O-antigen/teichoic acid export membrane protein